MRFILTVDNDNWRDDVGLEDDTDYHPIVVDLREYLDLVHPQFKRRRDAPTGRQGFFFSFLNFRGLRKLAEPVKSKGASWEHMQISSPPLKSCKLLMPWYTDFREQGERDDPHHEDYGPELENPSGVTVGEFVKAIRKTLAEAEELMKDFTHNIKDIVGYYQAHDSG